MTLEAFMPHRSIPGACMSELPTRADLKSPPCGQRTGKALPSRTEDQAVTALLQPDTTGSTISPTPAHTHAHRYVDTHSGGWGPRPPLLSGYDHGDGIREGRGALGHSPQHPLPLGCSVETSREPGPPPPPASRSTLCTSCWSGARRGQWQVFPVLPAREACRA